MPGQTSVCPQLKKQTLSFSAWNVKGLVDRILGDKFENQDFVDHLNKFDFIILRGRENHAEPCRGRYRGVTDLAYNLHAGTTWCSIVKYGGVLA